jgi:hypothetical protein
MRSLIILKKNSVNERCPTSFMGTEPFRVLVVSLVYCNLYIVYIIVLYNHIIT